MENQSAIKIVFAGTPEFAAKFLQDLITDNRFQVVGVLSQPDRPTGRKQIITPSPVKVLAIKNNIPCFQPEKLSQEPEMIKQIQALNADMLVVVAFGQILPQIALDLFPHGVINVHPSLLPLYRGASPIQSAILNGESKTGVSIMLLDKKMDHGPILSQRELILDGTETNESLHETAYQIASPLLRECIIGQFNGTIKAVEQDHSKATFCQMFERDAAKIDWTKEAKKISALIRALYPWPATWTTFLSKRVKIFPPVEIINEINQAPGKIIVKDKKLIIACGSGALVIHKLQLEGKNITSGEDFIRGQRLSEDSKFE